MKLKTYKPGVLKAKSDAEHPPYAEGSDFSTDAVHFDCKCWSCRGKFQVSISYANLHYSVWKCPHCGEPNETA